MTHKRSREEQKKKSKAMRDKQKAKKKARLALEKQLLDEEESRKKNNLRYKLNAVSHQNLLLKDALKKKRKTCTTTNNEPMSVNGGIILRQNGRYNAKKALVQFLPSMPAVLSENVAKVVKETNLKGVFGTLSVVTITFLNNLIAAQKTISLTNLRSIDIISEVKVMHAVSGHRLFPYCFGFLRPNKIVTQFLGYLHDGGSVVVHTVQCMRGTMKLNKYQWVSICCQIVEGIQFLHGLMILHNDIKSNNVILYGSTFTQVKIIDFGKSTLVTKPVVYNIKQKKWPNITKSLYNTVSQ